MIRANHHSISLPLYNNQYWKSHLWPVIKKILQIRAGTFWTAGRAHTTKKPYRIATGVHPTPFCPLCSHLSPALPPYDSSGHILGACKHPSISNCIVSRHNKAVCILQRSVALGSLSKYYTIMDATKRTALPFGVADTRLPSWMLPTLSDDVRTRLRPDLLIVEGLPLSSSLLHPPTNLLDPSILTSLQQSCTIHLVELGYTSDISLCDSLTRKRAQHNLLVHYLTSAGWKLATSPPSPQPTLMPTRLDHLHDAHLHVVALPPQLPAPLPDLSHFVHIILISTSGVIYKPTDQILSLLGISRHDADTCLKSIHKSAVSFANTITCLRRKLERTPHTFSHCHTVVATLPLPPHDPP